MKHHFQCDKCGGEVTAFGRGSSKDHVVIYDPPLEQELSLEERVYALLTHRFTILCFKCTEDNIGDWENEGGHV